MNVDLTSTFQNARQLINTWKARYTPEEYPYKVVLNIFYRKYTMEKIWPTVINNSHSDWEKAFQYNKELYSSVSVNEIMPVLEDIMKSNRQVGMIKFSDFQQYIQSSGRGNADAIKGIEYTYFLHRILDELIIVWISLVNAGETQINAIAKITRAVIAEIPINNYAEIEKIFDQLGAERYLQSLFMKEINNQL